MLVIPHNTFYYHNGPRRFSLTRSVHLYGKLGIRTKVDGSYPLEMIFTVQTFF